MFLLVYVYILSAHTRGRSENYVILHHENAFIVEDNILWHLSDTSDYTGSHEDWSQGCKIDLITHPKPCNGYTLVFVRFFTFSLILMNMQMR